MPKKLIKMIDQKEDSLDRPSSKLNRAFEHTRKDISPQPVLKTQRRFYSKLHDTSSIIFSQINPVDQSSAFNEQIPYKPDVSCEQDN